MKRRRTFAIMLLAGCVLFASTSCSRDELNIPSRDEADRVPVSLSLSVAGMQAGTPETKAIMEPEIDNLTLVQQIKNLVVLQFEGTDKGARLVDLPEYYRDASKVFDGTEHIRLLPTSKPSIIVVVANTFDNIYAQNGMTLAQFQQTAYSRMTDIDAVLTRDEDGNDYIRMSGSTKVGKIDDATSVPITLQRNVSKITIRVTNEAATKTGDDKMALHHAQLRDINAKYYYLTNIDNFEDIFSAEDPCRFDKGPEEWTDGATQQTFEYYVPANVRGTNGNNAQYTKGLGAPEGATRFCLYGTYGNNDTAINYTYYLGANLLNDFNLLPNYHYTYNLTISSRGNADTDYRIEDCKEVKFLVDANSYMVQPPQGTNQERIYAIPVRRAAVYWNNPSYGYNGVYGASDKSQYTNYKLYNGTKWTAEVLWSDFELDPNDFLSKASSDDGEGFPLTGEQTSFFKIRIKSGMRGNVIVAVRVGTEIVWSWHIWITDYNPDREALAYDSEKYVYGVEGGNVHRYDNNAFKANDKMFIMDRNLGSSGASYAGLNGTMYYQFGRKDPFLAYNQKGELDTYYTYKDGATQAKTGYPLAPKNTTGEENVLYTIINPQKFISTDTDAESWSKGNALVNPTNKWLDTKFEEHNDLSTLEKNKSIYDPCPPGWKVPSIEVFTLESGVSYTKDGGLLYTPKEGQAIYFPGHRFRKWDGTFSALTGSNRLSDIWSCDPVTTEGKEYIAQNFFFSSGTHGPRQLYCKSYGFSVRCVRDSEYVRENYIAD